MPAADNHLINGGVTTAARGCKPNRNPTVFLNKQSSITVVRNAITKIAFQINHLKLFETQVNYGSERE